MKHEISKHQNLFGKIMNIRVLILLGVALLAQVNLLAQNKRVYIAHGISTVMIETSKYYERNTFYDSFWEMDSDFKYGVLYLKTGDSIDDLGIRFNISRDRFETVSSVNEGVFIVNPDAISRIKRMSEYFAFYKYKDKMGELAKGYFKIIYDGDTKLLFRKAELHKSGKSGAFGYNPYKTFSADYYILKQGEEYPVYLKKHKKQILEALSFKGPQLDVYVEENHLRFSNVNHLVKILTYYDLLQQKQ